MAALIFVLSVLTFLGSLGALFVKRMRQRAGWVALTSLAVAVVSVYQIETSANEQPRTAGFRDATDQSPAPIKESSAPLNDAQARSLAITALAKVNAQCAVDLTILENPSALPNQHVLKVRCGEEANGKIYQIREGGAAPNISPASQQQPADSIQPAPVPPREVRATSPAPDVQSSVLNVPRGPLDYIAAFCRDDWGTDYSMVEYCKNSQFEAADKVKQIYRRIADDPVRLEILYKCVDDWPKGDGYDWEMVNYCYNNQNDAYNRLMR